MKNKKRSDSSSGEIHIHICASHVGNDGTDRAAAVTSFVSCEMFGGFLTYSDFLVVVPSMTAPPPSSLLLLLSSSLPFFSSC
ncbi:MAG: hypothetical protein M3275_00145 [Thermoproteota archaeon]|nr:hypothetical protein [Thermoproteota archaeon]